MDQMGSVDAHRAQFYGSVIRIGPKFCMWYLACDRASPSQKIGYRVAYAESEDGIHWVKPDLGLVLHGGNANNNLVALSGDLDFSIVRPLAAYVLYEPEEKEPSRRYKMAMYGLYYDSSQEAGESSHATIYPFFSSDGLRWNLAVPAPKRAARSIKKRRCLPCEMCSR